MKRRYTRKQLNEAIRYWSRKLHLAESGVLNERDLGPNEVQILADYIKKNKIEVAPLLKFDEIKAKSGDEKIEAAYQVCKKLADELKFSAKSVPAFHRAIKELFKGKEEQAKTPEKAAETITADPEKTAAALKAAEEGGNPPGGDGNNGDGNNGGNGNIDPKTEKAIDDKISSAKPEDIGAKPSIEAAEQAATAKPIGEMNLMDRLRRLHNATVKNVIAKLKKYLPFATGEDDIQVDNSCVKNGQFTIPDNGNMFVTVKVKVTDANRRGFKKFVAGMFGKAMNETDEEIIEGVIGKFFGGLWRGIKGAKEKLADGVKTGSHDAADEYEKNIAKVNEEMKKRIGVAAIQEYVRRFCGKALAKKVNFQMIHTAIENEGTESATYAFTGCINITK